MKVANLIAAFILLAGCDGIVGNIFIVKNGFLDMDETVTIGDAFDNWRICKETQWSEFISDNNKNIVEAKCVIEKQDNTKASFVIYFAMNKVKIGEFEVEGISKKFENWPVGKDCVGNMEVDIEGIDLLSIMYSNTEPSFEEQLAIVKLEEFYASKVKNECNKNKHGDRK
ncbi:hypothetical protein [Campylobacter concisus]|uniref:hypothetical protein n=1 Tax=Campylobacter concisus TaxID=199 RepID=UPI00122CB132|nr:hypothetical protein [Campylobacter concisus]